MTTTTTTTPPTNTLYDDSLLLYIPLNEPFIDQVTIYYKNLDTEISVDLGTAAVLVGMENNYDNTGDLYAMKLQADNGYLKVKRLKLTFHY